MALECSSELLVLEAPESFEQYKKNRSIRNILCNYSESGQMDQMFSVQSFKEIFKGVIFI